MKKINVFITAIIVFLLGALCCPAKELNEYLYEGAFDQGIIESKKNLKQYGATDEALFSLGVLQFFDGIENLSQSLYRYGLDRDSGRKANLPFLRLPIPANPKPETASASAIAGTIARFHTDMSELSKTLQGIKGKEFIIPIDIDKIRIDINANGQLEETEYFHQIYTVYNRRTGDLFTDGKTLTIDFDLGDAYWLKGYSHLLMAMTDMLLAYDWMKVYEYSAHLFFPVVESEIGSIMQEQNNIRYSYWADMIAGIHVMNLPVKQPKRLKDAHYHLLQVIECSRLSWGHIENEEDNQNEWIPNQNQTAVTGVRISREMIEGWKNFLAEFELILKAEKLVPHWRFKDGRGINLKKVFFEPSAFDVVLWVQGASAIPYLEQGEISSKETWRRITRTFQGNFIGFAIWVN